MAYYPTDEIRRRAEASQAPKPPAPPAPATPQAPVPPAPTPNALPPAPKYSVPPPPAAPPPPTAWDQSFKTFSANSDFRDNEHYSNPQWEAWNQEEAKLRAGGGGAQNCPPHLPFTGRNGQCAAKPDDCPDGMHVQGSDTNGTAKCVPDGAGGGGGGAAGAGGAGGAAGAPGVPGAGGMNQGLLDDMNQYWMNLTKQSGSRYTPEAMAALEADQFARARAQEKLQLEQAQGDMAQRGMSRSVNQGQTIRDIGIGTGNQIMANRAQIQKAKIDADFQDKQAAISNAQNWVNSMRDFLLRGDANAIQREEIAAKIRLANMNINAQKADMERQFGYSKDLREIDFQNNLASGYASGAWGGN